MSTRHVVLHNGVHMPLVGFGTWTVTDDLIRDCLPVAFEAGYRMIDTAPYYRNDVAIGEVIQSWISSGKLKRSDLFVITKLQIFAHGKADVKKNLQDSLKRLQLDFVDLFLIHSPMPAKQMVGPDGTPTIFTSDKKIIPDDVDYLETWNALEDLLENGLTRSIGVSNFNIQQIQRIINNCSVKPHNLQVECHPYCPQFELHDFCRQNSISFTAFGSLGSPGRRFHDLAQIGANFDEEPVPLEDSVVKSIAAENGKPPASILLKWLLQRNIAVIPKSTNKERIRSNFQLFDFCLNDKDMKLLNEIKTRQRFFKFPW
ncbi:oxidoreductase [Trichuris trichiura]|uniref:Oxidoreductase n=1 Tax=Trichuris trichiura TaxID=36087 RepID=A0A077Z5Q7_TRITR|nr:oxidoreductase [Trichuris trichiura]